MQRPAPQDLYSVVLTNRDAGDVEVEVIFLNKVVPTAAPIIEKQVVAPEGQATFDQHTFQHSGCEMIMVIGNINLKNVATEEVTNAEAPFVGVASPSKLKAYDIQALALVEG